jgi:hypothetical protein
MVEYFRDGCDKILVQLSTIQYNNGYGIEMYGAKNSHAMNNSYTGNGKLAAQEKISAEKIIIME